MNVVAPARTSVAVVVLWEVRALPGEWIGIWLRKDITYHPSRDRLAARPALPRPGDRPGEHACRIGRTRGGSDGPVLEHPDRGLGWRPVRIAQPRSFVGGPLHREAVGNISGGIRTKATYLDDLDLKLTVNGQRLIGWSGATLFVYGLSTHGGNPDDFVGD